MCLGVTGELMGGSRDGYDSNTLYTYMKTSKNKFLNITKHRRKKKVKVQSTRNTRAKKWGLC